MKLKVEELEEKLSGQRAKEAEELLLAQSMRVENSRLTEQSSHLTSELIRAENHLSELEQNLAELRKNNENSVKVMDKKKSDIIGIKQSVADAETQREILSEQLQNLEYKKEEQAGSHKGFIVKREEYSERVAVG